MRCNDASARKISSVPGVENVKKIRTFLVADHDSTSVKNILKYDIRHRVKLKNLTAAAPSYVIANNIRVRYQGERVNSIFSFLTRRVNIQVKLVMLKKNTEYR